jgi:hypothetical protein
VQRLAEKQLTDPMEAWMWRLEDALMRAPTELIGPIRTDVDPVEVPGPSGAMRLRRKLIYVKACVRMTLHLPPLPRGVRAEARGDTWLAVGPGPLQSEPLVELLSDALDPATVRLIVLPELLYTGERFLESDDWFNLPKDWSLGTIHLAVDARGIVARIDLHLEAA